MKKNFPVYIFFLTVILLFLFKPLVLTYGVPFRYDWSWPFFNVGNFWTELIGRTGAPFDFISLNAGLVLALVGTLSVTPQIAFKVFIVTVHFFSAAGFYLFASRRLSNKYAAAISAITYSFTPYIFIRTIIGYRWSLMSYAALPFLFHIIFNVQKKNWKTYLSGVLLLAIIFSQIQAGVLVTFLLLVYLLFSLKQAKNFIKDIIIVYLGFILITLPWFVRSLKQELNVISISENAVTTLQYIGMLPHRFRNLAILADHQITDNYFNALTRDRLFLVGILFFYLIVFIGIISSRDRRLKLVCLISALLVLPFAKGPGGLLGSIYSFVYIHFAPIRLFRETYHFQYLLSIILVLLFAYGLDTVFSRTARLRSKLKIITLNVLVGSSALFLIAPYFSFDYGEYLSLQKTSFEYSRLYDYLNNGKDTCSKIYYPPGMGFVYFNGDKTPNASNSDIIAYSLGVPFLDDGATYSFLPTEERFYRNELVSQFYEKSDNGEFASLLNESNIDCVILRLDTESKYYQASNLWREKDPANVKKWNNNDLKTLVESKRGMKLEKQFGEYIYIYKISNCSNCSNQVPNPNDKILKTGQSVAQQFNNLPAGRQGSTIQQLPLTDWATNYAYYKDGWSRGRYDFWRKHLFTQLRQDFIYTDKKDSILTGKIDQKGDYELWARFLVGGMEGELEIKIQDTRYKIRKDPGEEKFIWKKIGDIKLNGQTEIEIKNITGENAITDIVFVNN